MKRVLFRPQAARDLERLPIRDRDQVEEAIERFVQTGSGDIKKMLAGEGRRLTSISLAYATLSATRHKIAIVAASSANQSPKRV